ncbi:MAG: NADH:flavin oxidoreductase/NADH oxidase [Bacteroidota bacterium]
MSHLFDAIKLREVEVKNRIVVSPMCQYSSVDGFANDWHLVHLGSRAVGGAGIIFTEATAVCEEGRITRFDLGIWSDEHIKELKRITEFIKKQSGKPGIQLAHAGRKASRTVPWAGNQRINENQGGWSNVMAPSALAFDEAEPSPQEMSHDDIGKLITAYREATLRSLEAGFKILEIHAAHGYLLHEFLSPISNQRTDEYGGSFENRTRLLKSIVKEVRKVWVDDYPLFVRLSVTDWLDDRESWTFEDSMRIAEELKELGVDVIDCSSGGIIAGATIPVGPGYQTEFSAKIKEKVQVMTGSVGMITSAQQADHIIRTGQADLVLMARQMLREPYFPLHAAGQLRKDVVWPVQYERAKGN